MTDDLHIDGHNEEMEFEREDLGAKPILIFLLALIVGCVLVAILLKGMYSLLDRVRGPPSGGTKPAGTADHRRRHSKC